MTIKFFGPVPYLEVVGCGLTEACLLVDVGLPGGYYASPFDQYAGVVWVRCPLNFDFAGRPAWMFMWKVLLGVDGAHVGVLWKGGEK